jgi:glycosyltransferase involved in cell wall biosynthesis
MKVAQRQNPSICFVGINNLPALTPEFPNRGVGGAELQQTLLAKALVRAGFPVSMIVADLGQPDGAEWHGIKTYKAYRPDAGIPGPRFIYPRWTGVWAALKRANADIRYCSCAGLLPGQLALFGKYHSGKVVFRIAHDTDCRPDELMIPNWRSKVLYRYGLRRVDLILAQTATQQLEMKKNFGRDSRVIPSLLELSPDNRSFADRDIDLLWVSNIRPFKRPDLALDLASRVPDLTLHMVGGLHAGADDYFAKIQARASALPNVRFHGQLPYDEVNRLIARTRLLINTSDSEGFPNTYLQAWARGTPVVPIFDPDGVVARERLGRSVQTVEQMYAAVREYLANRDLWAATSARCVQYAAARHGDAAVRSYIDAFASLTERAAA